MSEITVLTVSQLNRYIASKLKADDRLSNVLIRGEISNFNNHYKTGHWYFTLKDEASALKGVMFNWANQRMQFIPEDGMSVIVQGDIQVYEAGGVYQIYVKDIIPDGAGALSLAFEQLKNKLASEGLFDEEHKRPINPLPNKICVITAETGAALQDVLNILSRRCPVVEVLLIPTLVQGKNAPQELCKSIELANTTDCDTIILCRGGGSIEDLWAFNDERLARTVYDSKIPVISAVGHEIDFTICDFVADLRAPTPSAAAELAVPDKSEVIFQLDSKLLSLKSKLMQKLESGFSLLGNYDKILTAKSPYGVIKTNKTVIGEIETKLDYNIEKILTTDKNKLLKNAELISAYNPLAILSKGYSLTYSKNKVIKNADEVAVGETITVKFHNSELSATVTERKTENDI